MLVNAFEPLRDDTPVPGNGLEFSESAAPSIYLLYRARPDLNWFGDESCEVAVESLDRFLSREVDRTRRSDGAVYAFWRWPANDAHRIERLIFQRLIERFGRPIAGRRRFLVPNVELAYHEITGILDMDGTKAGR